MKFVKGLAIILIWATAIFGIKILNQIYMADTYMTAEKDKVLEEHYDLALKKINKSVELNYFEPNYHKEKARTLLIQQLDPDSKENRGVLKDQAYEEMKIAAGLNSNNLVTLRNLVPLYYFLAVANLDKPANASNLDEKYWPIARAYFDELKIKYSTDAGVISIIAGYEKKLNLNKGYEKSVEMIEQLRPDLLNWYSSFVN